MIIITGQYCPHEHCGGALAAEIDTGACRLVCTACGRDRWLPLPEPSSEPVATTLYRESERAAGRRCLDCRVDISGRHQNAMRCVDCAMKANAHGKPGAHRKKTAV